MEGFVKIEVHNELGIVNFHHPKGNSLPYTLLQDLKKAFLDLGKENVKVITLESEGDSVFCSGASFTELLELNQIADAERFFLGFAELMEVMVNSKAIIIGKIKGKVIGGGVGIVSACDYVFTTEEVLFKLSELKVGIGPFAIGPMVMFKLGQLNFATITLSPNKWFKSDCKEVSGLVSEITPVNQIDDEVYKKANELVSYSREALISIKEMIWQNKNELLDEMKQNAKISAKLTLQSEAQQFLKEL